MNEDTNFEIADTPTVRFDITKMDELSHVDENPFLHNVKFDTKIILKRFKKGVVVDNEECSIPLDKSIELTKQREEIKKIGLDIAQRKTRQIGAFVLLYTNPLINYKNMSEVTFKILFLIIDKRLNYGNDTIVLSIEDCCTELSVTRPTVQKGLIELIRNKVIYPRMTNVWWINPTYIFNGNRTNIKSK